MTKNNGTKTKPDFWKNVKEYQVAKGQRVCILILS